MKNRLVSFCALLAVSALLIFAADISGTWKSEAPAGGKGGPSTFVFKVDGSTLTGTMEGGRGGPVNLSDGKVDGDNISFSVTRDFQGQSMTTKYTGKVTSDGITLSYEGRQGTREMKLTKQ